MYFDYIKQSSENILEGMSRKILAHSDNIMSVETTYKKGAGASTHSHEHEQISYIIEGEFLFTINDEKHICQKGDSIYNGRNVSHGCKCLKDGKILYVFTPAREDFLHSDK